MQNSTKETIKAMEAVEKVLSERMEELKLSIGQAPQCLQGFYLDTYKLNRELHSMVKSRLSILKFGYA